MEQTNLQFRFFDNWKDMNWESSDQINETKVIKIKEEIYRIILTRLSEYKCF